VSLEERAEEGDVPITDGVTDLLHGAMVALQQALGGGDSELLQVGQRAVSSSLPARCGISSRESHQFPAFASPQHRWMDVPMKRYVIEREIPKVGTLEREQL
jgi:hypothetical protein